MTEIATCPTWLGFYGGVHTDLVWSFALICILWRCLPHFEWLLPKRRLRAYKYQLLRKHCCQIQMTILVGCCNFLKIHEQKWECVNMDFIVNLTPPKEWYDAIFVCEELEFGGISLPRPILCHMLQFVFGHPLKNFFV